MVSVTNLSVKPRKRLENQSSRVMGLMGHYLQWEPGKETLAGTWTHGWCAKYWLCILKTLLSLSFFFCEKGVVKPALPECCLHMHSNKALA